MWSLMMSGTTPSNKENADIVKVTEKSQARYLTPYLSNSAAVNRG